MPATDPDLTSSPDHPTARRPGHPPGSPTTRPDSPDEIAGDPAGPAGDTSSAGDASPAGETGSAADAASPLLTSAGSLLFQADDAVPELHDLLTEQLPEVWTRLTRTGIGLDLVAQVTGELAAEIVGLVQIDVVGAALRAWAGSQSARTAARASAGPPPSTQTLVLGPHTLTSVVERSIEILVGDLQVASIPISLELSVDASHASVTAQAGRLVRLRPGPAEIALTLSVASRVVRTARGALPLPASIPLGRWAPLDEDPLPDRGSETAPPEPAGAPGRLPRQRV
ncbi:hypothetical protein ACG83_31300 [Frankia sp. R43]|uniref:hypothetical protein n=1 Tax=Frankia sp. R43 TaxID=269536 RepID=UPI0006CA29BF|nr:hypothetical protein [Frankia sp. R43]KPM52041.1 hypothetical protein ACG83_31300 [Frankia sp. R43]